MVKEGVAQQMNLSLIDRDLCTTNHVCQPCFHVPILKNNRYSKLTYLYNCKYTLTQVYFSANILLNYNCLEDIWATNKGTTT